MCPYYDQLAPVLFERASTRPLYSSDAQSDAADSNTESVAEQHLANSCEWLFNLNINSTHNAIGDSTCSKVGDYTGGDARTTTDGDLMRNESGDVDPNSVGNAKSDSDLMRNTGGEITTRI
ncbi:hypothetical protein PRIC1_010045 [Phytophthora ramorum]